MINNGVATFLECPVCLDRPGERGGNFKARGHRCNGAIHAVCLPCIQTAGLVPIGAAGDNHLLTRCLICRATVSDVAEEIFTIDSTGNVLSSTPAPRIQRTSTQFQIGSLSLAFRSSGPLFEFEAGLRYGNPYEEMSQIGNSIARTFVEGTQLVDQQASTIWANVFGADQSEA